MTPRKYLLAIKRLYNYSYPPVRLSPDEQYYQYAQYDNYAGSFSTGYPVFGDICHAIRFPSIADAEKWLSENQRDLHLRSHEYDFSSLCILEERYEEVKKLEVECGYIR